MTGRMPIIMTSTNTPANIRFFIFHSPLHPFLPRRRAGLILLQELQKKKRGPAFGIYGNHCVNILRISSDCKDWIVFLWNFYKKLCFAMPAEPSASSDAASTRLRRATFPS